MISTAQKVRDKFAMNYPKGWTSRSLSSGKTLSTLSRLRRIFSGANTKSKVERKVKNPLSVWNGIRDVRGMFLTAAFSQMLTYLIHLNMSLLTELLISSGQHQTR